MTTVLPPHPVPLHAPALLKRMGERDRLTIAPDLPEGEEITVLLRQKAKNHNSSYNGRKFEPLFDANSYRGEPPALKLAAMRCAWFGWVLSTWRLHWDHVGWVSDSGNAVLLRHLSALEQAGDAEAATLRRRYYETEAERKAREVEYEARQERERLRWIEETAKRERLIDEAHGHRSRKLGLETALRELALDIGRGKVNDIESALDRMRDLTRRYDAECAWRNPEDED